MEFTSTEMWLVALAIGGLVSLVCLLLLVRRLYSNYIKRNIAVSYYARQVNNVSDKNFTRQA